MATTTPDTPTADLVTAHKELAAILVAEFTDPKRPISARRACQMVALAMAVGALQGRKDRARFEALETENESLRARVAELEARPGLAEAYKDVWRQDRRYTPGQWVTHSGSLWIAKSASVSRRPGGPDGVWQLAVKRGADGKDCPHCRGEVTEATS